MSIVDIGIIVIMLLFTLLGLKRGVIKSAVKLIGLVVVTIVSFSLKGMLANWLMSFMPFFNFQGIFHDVYAVNILFYEVASFAIVFIVLYSLINVFASLAGIFDKLFKATVILAIPDKIFGAMIGFVEGAMFVFIGIFILSQMPNTSQYVFDSTWGHRILHRTPVIRTVLSGSTLAAEEIYDLALENMDVEDRTEFNIAALRILIKYNIVTPSQVEQFEQDNKVGVQYISFG